MIGGAGRLRIARRVRSAERGVRGRAFGEAEALAEEKLGGKVGEGRREEAVARGEDRRGQC